MTEVEAAVAAEVQNGDVTIDLGNMAVFDAQQPKTLNESVLMQMAAAHCQELVAKLFELPSERADNGRVVCWIALSRVDQCHPPKWMTSDFLFYL